ncbi:MAG: ATP synthase F0 subunit B [Bryobacteraceae bacterium]|jgi:F-type H+-transporting ATPase subunit b
MEDTLRALGGLLLQAIPTFLIVVLLYFYLKRMYFRPMERVLAARYEATEGARKLAEESLAKASRKAAEYDAALRAARAEIYREQEAFRQTLRQEQAQAVEAAHQRATTVVKEAGLQLDAELAAARESLRQEAGALADRIVESILRRRPV